MTEEEQEGAGTRVPDPGLAGLPAADAVEAPWDGKWPMCGKPDQAAQKAADDKLHHERTAYRDGYQQGFYDRARGNPSRFEEL